MVTRMVLLRITGLALYCASVAAEGDKVVVSPAKGIGIDGTIKEWTSSGALPYKLKYKDGLLNAGSAPKYISLAWCSEGLQLVVNVIDDSITETPDSWKYWYKTKKGKESLARRGEIWKHDCVEIYFAPGVGAEEWKSIIITPGGTKKYPCPRMISIRHPYRKTVQPKEAYPVSYASSVSDSGYCIEVLIPPEVLGAKMRPGTHLGLNVVVKDVDGDKEKGRYSWHEGHLPAFKPYHMMDVVLIEHNESKWSRHRLQNGINNRYRN